MPYTNHSHASLDMMDDPDSTGPVSAKLDTARLSTLGKGEGARITDRHNASEAASRAQANARRRTASRKRVQGKHLPDYARQGDAARRPGRHHRVLLVVLVVVGALLLVGVSAGVRSCASSMTLPSEEDVVTGLDAGTGTQGASQSSSDDAQRVTADNGVSYELAQAADGTWQVSYENGASVLFTLEGTPVCLLTRANTLVVPENLAGGGWDVVAFTLVDGSEASQVVGEDGKPVTGDGSVEQAEIDGSTLRLVLSDGTSRDVAL